MNKIWTTIILASLVLLSFTKPELTLPALLTGSTNAVNLIIELLAIYTLWLGVIKIVENTKLSRLLSLALTPLINLLWGKNLKKETKQYLSLSLSLGVLGIGGASVPYGIKAIETMDDGTGIVTFPMIMTIVFASSGVQLLPTTVMSLMTTSGSTNPTFIIMPTLLSGFCTTIVGVVLALIFEKISKKIERKKVTK